MQASDFEKGSPGRLVSSPSGSKAFVPHPLPPRLDLTWTLVRDLSQADRALSELAGTAHNLANPALLQMNRPFVRREAVLSSRIEGTQSEASDVLIYEAGQRGLLPDETSRNDAQEVANYGRALDFGVERMRLLPVSLRLIRELHEKLMDGVRGENTMPGEFRRSQNWIGPPGASIEAATYVPPPPQDMEESLAALEVFLHAPSELPPLVRIALVHYQFEAIHPFLDGNGRIGRLLIPLLLIQEQLLPAPLLYLSAYFERTRATYYSLLLDVSRKGTWGEWVRYFLQGVASQSVDAIERSRRLLDLQRIYRMRLEAGRAPGPLLHLVDALFETPMIGTTEAARRAGVTYATARSYVQRLERVGILKQVGSGAYDRLYAAPGIIELIQADRLPDLLHDVPGEGNRAGKAGGDGVENVQ
jgi:Fic family protein